VATDAYPANFEVTCQVLDERDNDSETECKCALSSSCCQIVASFLGPVNTLLLITDRITTVPPGW